MVIISALAESFIITRFWGGHSRPCGTGAACRGNPRISDQKIEAPTTALLGWTEVEPKDKKQPTIIWVSQADGFDRMEV